MSRFVIGLTYEVGSTVGNYLLSMKAGVPVDADVPALVLPIEDVAEILFQKPTPLDKAADRPPRKKKQARTRR